MILEAITCPHCRSDQIIKHGTTAKGAKRYRCQEENCSIKTFIRDYTYNAYKPNINQKIVDMTLNSSGIRDIARVLEISTHTVINVLKKTEDKLESVNQSLLNIIDNPLECKVKIEKVKDAELDEMWSFVQNKEEQYWLWHAIDHKTGKILAYVFGRRTDEVFNKLKELLEPFRICNFYTDNWGAYERNLNSEKHHVGKQNTQKIERKHLTLRTRIKRLARKTICFSKTKKMHRIVIGLFINRYEFGVVI